MREYSLPYQITIRKAENGYVCSWREEVSGDPPKTERKQLVFEHHNAEDERTSELEVLQRVFCQIAEHFGAGKNKRTTANLVVKVEKKKDD